jgi:hypothetical protein
MGSIMADQSVPDSIPLQPGDEVSYQLHTLPSNSQRIIGKVEAVREDGLVTAAFPQADWTPMLITDKREGFVRIRTTPDVAAAFAAGRAQAAADALAVIPVGDTAIIDWLHSHGLGMAGPGAVLESLRHDIKQAMG